MSRLIDADKLIEDLKESYDDCEVQTVLEYFGIYEFIKEQPTAYDVDKVVEQLEELSHFGWIEVRKEEVFEIVKTGGRGITNMCIDCALAGYSKGRPYCTIEKRHLDSFSYKPDWCSLKAGGTDES